MKQMFKKITYLTTIIASGLTIGTAMAEPNKDTPSVKIEAPVIKIAVLSFLEWKSMRVHEAQQKLETAGRAQGTPASVWQEGKPMAEVTDENVRPNEQKLNFNVDVALQLNIHDYFSIYLKTLNPEEFKEATAKLSEEEKSDLLMAYKNSTEKEKKIPVKFTKNPKDNAKSKNTEIQ